jgi:hypothetical protein
VILHGSYLLPTYDKVVSIDGQSIKLIRSQLLYVTLFACVVLETHCSSALADRLGVLLGCVSLVLGFIRVLVGIKRKRRACSQKLVWFTALSAWQQLFSVRGDKLYYCWCCAQFCCVVAVQDVGLLFRFCVTIAFRSICAVTSGCLRSLTG